MKRWMDRRECSWMQQLRACGGGQRTKNSCDDGRRRVQNISDEIVEVCGDRPVLLSIPWGPINVDLNIQSMVTRPFRARAAAWWFIQRWRGAVRWCCIPVKLCPTPSNAIP